MCDVRSVTISKIIQLVCVCVCVCVCCVKIRTVKIVCALSAMCVYGHRSVVADLVILAITRSATMADTRDCSSLSY